ncbi:MAG: LLM class flavin-dependent oxidoreductase [Gammaproteobacteria bacterium]|nr:LLM class flavin-dependent oxidoreductase [Gammaproteobacteria bacterium]
MAQVEFGMFDWIDRGVGTLQQLYAERLVLIQMADRAGFFGYHLAEHHGTPLGMAPSPSVFLAAVAQATQKIRFGPMAYLLPLYDPLRLTEEICMLDQLSGGRAEIGISRGVSPYELACFGVNAGGTREIFTEALDVIRKGMLHDVLNHQGKHFQYRDVPMEIKPLQKPYPPLWYPTHNPDSVVYAAQHGYHFASIGPTSLIRQLIERYRKVWAEHEHDSDRINGHISVPKLGAMRQIFIADTDEAAMSIARTAYRSWYESITKLWHRHNDHAVDGLFDWDSGIAAETILVGSPSRIREQVARLINESGINYVVSSFAWGSLTHAQSTHSLELFVKEVIPAVTG